MEKIEHLEDLIYFLKSKRWNKTIASDLEGFYEYLEEKYQTRKNWEDKNIEAEFIEYLQGKYLIRKKGQKTEDEKENEEKEFNEYFEIAETVVTTTSTPSDNKTLVIVGGQSGAGKSRLLKTAKREFGNNAVIVNFDELREIHPNHTFVHANYPEWTHRILHPDTEEVKNRVLDSVMADGYNVIYEGALRNTQGFIDFAKKFQECGYDIQMKIMSVPKLESYGSTFFRYAFDLMSDKTPRWVEKSAHDGSYDGVVRTTQEFINQGLVSGISVYVRSANEPRKIYSTPERQYPDAITAILQGRELGRNQAVKDFDVKYKMVEEAFKSRQPDMLETLDDWRELYEKEREYIDRNQKNK